MNVTRFLGASVLPLVLTLLFIASCRQKEVNNKSTLFTLLDSGYTNINFSNNLSYNATFNPFTFHSFYNGGGVAIGDINNDGLPDVFFCSNQGRNKLYLNLGDMRFEDISFKAGFLAEGIWTSGATFVDINGDGYLDLFTSISADFSVGWRGNELYINNGDMTFTERSGDYNLKNLGYSTHAAFFDYDNDGDLDCYLLGNSGHSSANYYGVKEQRNVIDTKGGNRLLRNDNGRFTDVTQEAKIYGSSIGYGLGVAISDINKDGWQDIYVSNDFFEKDYLYINQGNGTFLESLEKYIHEISFYSMGADIADINNDGYSEIFVTDMLPENEARIKSKTSFENWEKYQANISNGYYKQFLRNTLQLNLGPNNISDKPEFYFSEISRLAGIQATDWSWSSLIADFDNDGLKDVFVSNGMYKDVTDQDFIQFVASDSMSRALHTRDGLKNLIDLIPSHPQTNYAFHNNGNLTFTNMANEWGLNQPVFSNGSVYVDLDNDGDLDIVTNNINQPASVYRNNATDLLPENKFLKVLLKGEGKNKFATGSKVTLYYGQQKSYQEVMPTRGFESCVDFRLNFGIGKTNTIDSLVVEWPDGRISKLENVSVNKMVILKQADAEKLVQPIVPLAKPIFQTQVKSAIQFDHRENEYNEFLHDRLNFFMHSTPGPQLAWGDANNDGLQDCYIGNAKGSAGALFIQNRNNEFEQHKLTSATFDQEDTDAVFFDADGDGDQDLYVCSGGNESTTDTLRLADKLYLNDGKANYSLSSGKLPPIYKNSSCVSAADIDHDGDIDLFVGTQTKTNRYGFKADEYILLNDGKGKFTDATTKLLPSLKSVGMITDGEWFDYDHDQKPDLVICGEYMPIRVYHNEGDHFVEVTEAAGLSQTSGWWNRLLITDLNKDGYPDIVGGNHGLNSRFKASVSRPITLYANDFDGNGRVEAIVCTYNGEVQYPMSLRHDLISAIPSLKKKYLKYKNYVGQKITDIFSKEQINGSVISEASLLETSVFINSTKGSFARIPLPM